MLTWLALALAVASLPLALEACCAPVDRRGLGTVWFVNDFAQYESAMLQGAEQSGWLIHDPFTVEPHSPALMFPLYVAIGKASAATGVPSGVLERIVELLSRAAFVVALWRFTRRFATSDGAAKAAFLLALFGGGLGFLVAILGQALNLGTLYGGNFSYETTSLGLLFAAPHVPLAMAGSLELAGWLRPIHRASARQLGVALLLGAGLALLHPFHLPVLLSALAVCGTLWWLTRSCRATLLAAVAAGIGSLPVLIPTVLTFSLDGFWNATYSQQNWLPSPAPHELVVDLGVALVLALIGAIWGRERVVPFGLGIWLLFALVAMYLPVPYQRRLAFGAAPAVALLAGNALAWLSPRLTPRAMSAVRLAVTALAGAGSMVVLLSVGVSSISNAPLPVYRSTPALDAAAAWLNQNIQPGDVIAADWTVSNFLAGKTLGRLLGGHPVATLHPAQKQFYLDTLFVHGGNLGFARTLGARWVVYGPAEAAVVRPGDVPAFEKGRVAVFRVPGSS